MLNAFQLLDLEGLSRRADCVDSCANILAENAIDLKDLSIRGHEGHSIAVFSHPAAPSTSYPCQPYIGRGPIIAEVFLAREGTGNINLLPWLLLSKDSQELTIMIPQESNKSQVDKLADSSRQKRPRKGNVLVRAPRGSRIEGVNLPQDYRDFTFKSTWITQTFTYRSRDVRCTSACLHEQGVSVQGTPIWCQHWSPGVYMPSSHCGELPSSSRNLGFSD